MKMRWTVKGQHDEHEACMAALSDHTTHMEASDMHASSAVVSCKNLTTRAAASISEAARLAAKTTQQSILVKCD
jgi:hypothetical protein